MSSQPDQLPKETPGQGTDLSIKVLSLHQPYASMIARGVKTIETRSWAAPVSLIGQRVAIHAAAKRPAKHGGLGDYRFDRYDDEWYMRPREQRFLNSWGYLPLGKIVATALLVECLPMVASITIGEHTKVERVLQLGPSVDRLPIIDRWVGGGEVERYVTDQLPYGDFQIGRWAWMLDDVQALDNPVSFKGGQGLSRSWSPALVDA